MRIEKKERKFVCLAGNIGDGDDDDDDDYDKATDVDMTGEQNNKKMCRIIREALGTAEQKK